MRICVYHTETCKPLRFPGTTSVCDKNLKKGRHPKGTVCMFDCREGCVKRTGGRRRVCKVRGRSKWWTGGRSLECESCTHWTRWYNRDNPSGRGDNEAFPWLRNENPGQICSAPSAIEARVRGTLTPASHTGEQFYRFDTIVGFACFNIHQTDGYCLDYEVRFCCSQNPPYASCLVWPLYGPSADENYTQSFCVNYDVLLPEVTALTSTFSRSLAELGLSNVLTDLEDLRDVGLIPFAGELGPITGGGDGACTHWTRWYNRDHPSGNGDYENLLYLRRENPGQICSAPSAIEARVRGTLTPASQTGEQFLNFDTTVGFECRNIDQTDRYCLDYEVRFCCPLVHGSRRRRQFVESTHWNRVGDVTSLVYDADSGAEEQLVSFAAPNLEDIGENEHLLDGC
ncbi:CILP2 [Branchiostoma lanceolatum]|uniref:CILP2 protein n=1 Tax=Branchiostoma lanceolatum TaxID=7740 RepID=A0A8J9Z6B9_BRALA|nr:CILP2 [Branchiostoma lanceolatum]